MTKNHNTVYCISVKVLKNIRGSNNSIKNRPKDTSRDNFEDFSNCNRVGKYYESVDNTPRYSANNNSKRKTTVHKDYES